MLVCREPPEENSQGLVELEASRSGEVNLFGFLTQSVSKWKSKFSAGKSWGPGDLPVRGSFGRGQGVPICVLAPHLGDAQTHCCRDGILGKPRLSLVPSLAGARGAFSATHRVPLG